jgi:8-oxo-dGTP pyrophosphatase MutT (NUDIX family)
MDFSQFKKHISKLSSASVGGLEAQFKLAPKMRKQYSQEFMDANNPKKAAVLVLFYPNLNNDTCFLLTKRASYNGTHSAQISFPGGKFDSKDSSLRTTAIRETYEEVGIQLKDTSIFKKMTTVFIPPSNFIVTPYLAISNEHLTFTKNHEVEDTIEVNLTDLLNENSISSSILSTSYAKEMTVPCFKLNNYIVWGATAMMLNEIRELLKKV